MAKKGLSSAQLCRVNELSFELFHCVLEISKEDYPEFLKRVNPGAEYGVFDAISSALRVVYLPDSGHKDDFMELLMFMERMCERYRSLILDGATDECIGRHYVILVNSFLQICDMAAKKGIRTPKK